MKRAILTVGPRGAGKTTFCKKITEEAPGVAFLSRDQFLISLYGREAWNPYSGAMHAGMLLFWDAVKDRVRRHTTTIVDTWNGKDSERCNLVNKLRRCGADVVEAWYFITPLELTTQWFIEREYGEKRALLTKSAERQAKSDWEYYHSVVGDLREIFDVVRTIDPRQGVLLPYSTLWDI